MPQPKKCGAELGGGGVCEELATVTTIKYVYDREPVDGGPNAYNLVEIHYTAVCPKCGERKLVEKAE